jgi:hypothetical protein
MAVRPRRTSPALSALAPTAGAVLLLLACGRAELPGGGPPAARGTLTLAFPSVALRPGERIVGVEVVVTRGAVTAVTTIPLDWSVDVEADPSWQATVTGGAHHGAGALDSPAALNPFLAIHPYAEGFDVRATLHATVDFEQTREIHLGRADLILTRRPGRPPSRSPEAGPPRGVGVFFEGRILSARRASLSVLRARPPLEMSSIPAPRMGSWMRAPGSLPTTRSVAGGTGGPRTMGLPWSLASSSVS